MKAKKRRINVHREQEKAYERGVNIDIDIGSHNLPGKGRNAFRSNPRHKISPPEQKTIVKFLKKLSARSRAELKARARARRKMTHTSYIARFYVQYEKREGEWVTLGAFPTMEQARDYAKAIHRKHKGKKLRLWWR